MSEVSVIPQTSPGCSFTDEETEKLTDRIQNAGTEVVNAKAGAVRTLARPQSRYPGLARPQSVITQPTNCLNLFGIKPEAFVQL